MKKQIALNVAIKFLTLIFLATIFPACASPTSAPILPTATAIPSATSIVPPTSTPTLTSTPLPTLTPTITPTPAPDTSAALALARAQIKNFDDKDFSVTATWLADKRALVVIQSKIANDAWVWLPGAKELAIILLSDANGAVKNVGWDEQLKMFTAERGGEKVYYAPWLPRFGIDQLWTKNPLAPPPEKVLNAKTDAEMMQAAVESLNPGPEFNAYFTIPYTGKYVLPPTPMTIREAISLANARHVKTELNLPDFTNLPPELANARQVAIDTRGLPMKPVFAAYIGRVGALPPSSNQMAVVEYNRVTHRYDLFVNPLVLKPEFIQSNNAQDMAHAQPQFARAFMAFVFRGACEAMAKELINQNPNLGNRLDATLALCNASYQLQMAGNANEVDIFAGVAIQGDKLLALKLWREGNYNSIAQRVIYMFWEITNQKLIDWKTATAPTSAR